MTHSQLTTIWERSLGKRKPKLCVLLLVILFINVSFVLANSHEINPDNETGLVALWHLNNDSGIGENSTHVVDSASWINNGTIMFGDGEEIVEGA